MSTSTPFSRNRFTRDFSPETSVDVGRLDPEEVGEQLADGDVGAVVDRWRGDPELHRVAVTPHDRGAAGARLHMHAEHDGIALDGVRVGPTGHIGPRGVGGCP